MTDIRKFGDVISGGSQGGVGVDYRLTTVFRNFKGFETLLERFQAPGSNPRPFDS